MHHASVGPGIKEPEVRTHEYLQEIAIELARYKAMQSSFLTCLTFLSMIPFNCLNKKCISAILDATSTAIYNRLVWSAVLRF